MKSGRVNKTKAVIVVLSVLLALSLISLGVMYAVGKYYTSKETVAVPDNLITPDSTVSSSTEGDGNATSADTPLSGDAATAGALEAGEARTAASIMLYSKVPSENEAFVVKNMFPGDSETKYFRVRVSFHDRVAVHFNAAVRPGYEKLSEVLKVKITLLSTGEILYDGLMKDMPESVTHTLSSYSKAVGELYYEITAYLETSVGNDYQDRGLIADFKWWVEDLGALDDLPFTGDTFSTSLFAAAAVFSGGMLLILLFLKKKEEGKAHE